ncbi:uncharacterized protein LTR77_003591 [Saxophila tyrrhenica]|uniref:Uncharacterized protein n=1 Tax=Saxophila tyrrhenica TaxID=1690608 RepID=A0AAV9PIE7_9PEZI|nr:hypothetical protein LTR77_003591 [Saxophila tyrrhenica]
MGSISKAPYMQHLPAWAYKMSKAAVNMLTVDYSLQLNDEGFTVFPLSPGWLKTDLGSQHAHLEVDVGVKATLEIILDAGPESNGRFRDIKVPGWEQMYPGKDSAW